VQATRISKKRVHTSMMRRRRSRPLARVPGGRHAQRGLPSVLRDRRRWREHATINGAFVERQRSPVRSAAERHSLRVQVTVQRHGQNGGRGRRRLQVRQRRRFVFERRVKTLDDRTPRQIASQRGERGFLGCSRHREVRCIYIFFFVSFVRFPAGR